MAEIAIAALAVVAYFLGAIQSLLIAGGGLVLLHLLLSWQRREKGQACKVRRGEEAYEPTAQRLRQLLEESIQLPMPHRNLVSGLLKDRHGDSADLLMAQYDRLAKAINEKSFAAEELAAAWGDKVEPWVVATYLQGVAARDAGDLFAAKRFFWKATRQKKFWASPWLGWVATAFELRNVEEILQHHPLAAGLELQPLDCGDEDSLRTAGATDQAAVAKLFQSTSHTLLDFYELAKSESATVARKALARKVNAAA